MSPGLFDHTHMAYQLLQDEELGDRLQSNLIEMSAKAIEMLSHSSGGYLLLVESLYIRVRPMLTMT